MTTTTLVLDAPTKPAGLAEDLQGHGFTVLPTAEVRGRKLQVFRAKWSRFIGPFWILPYVFDVATAFLFARVSRFLLLCSITAVATMGIGYWDPTINPSLWIIAILVIWIFVWGTYMPRWRYEEFPYRMVADIPMGVRMLGNRAVVRFNKESGVLGNAAVLRFGVKMVWMERFGHHYFLTVKRSVGLLGVEICRIAAWSADDS